VPAVERNGVVLVETIAPTQTLQRLTDWAAQRDVVLAGITVERPSLEDVYLRLTSESALTGAPEGSSA
jgi:ABC-2 type transport system ATP-binding protein